MVGVYGDLTGVTIWLADFEEQGEVEFMTIGIEILSDIVTDNSKTKDWWDIVLGERAYGGFCNLGVES